MAYLKSVENVITLGKLIRLLFLFCLPLLSILFLKTKRNDFARPVMGTIFLVYVTVPGKRAHVAQIMIFPYRRYSATTPKNNSRDQTFVFVSEVSPTLCLHSR